MKIKVVILFLLFNVPLRGSPSLFFTEKEMQLIQSANHKIPENTKILMLSSLIYVDQHHWSISLNGRLIQAQQTLKIKNLRLERVTPQKVRFSWRPLDSSKHRIFTLCPNRRMLLEE